MSWGGGGIQVGRFGVLGGGGWGAQAPLTSPCAPSNHTITINLTLTFAASYFGHASHVDWSEQDPPNSVAFGSAPRREADSQPIGQLDRLAVSQTKTHTLGFLSVADTGPSNGENNGSQNWQWPNGNAGGRRLFGWRFKPRCGQYGSRAAAGVHGPGVEPPT